MVNRTPTPRSSVVNRSIIDLSPIKVTAKVDLVRISATLDSNFQSSRCKWSIWISGRRQRRRPRPTFGAPTAKWTSTSLAQSEQNNCNFSFETFNCFSLVQYRLDGIPVGIFSGFFGILSAIVQWTWSDQSKLSSPTRKKRRETSPMVLQLRTTAAASPTSQQATPAPTFPQFRFIQPRLMFNAPISSVVLVYSTVIDPKLKQKRNVPQKNPRRSMKIPKRSHRIPPNPISVTFQCHGKWIHTHTHTQISIKQPMGCY